MLRKRFLPFLRNDEHCDASWLNLKPLMRSPLLYLLRVLLVLTLLAPAGTLLGADQLRVQSGQTIKITVSGHPEFSERLVVRQDGTIEYPLLAGIPLDGLTATDVRDLLVPVLLRFESEPDVFVIISEERTIDFQVQGEVRMPQRFTAETPINVQQAITMAGGVTLSADQARINVLRIENDKRKILNIDLTSMFRRDTLELAPELEEGDVVIVPRQNEMFNVRIMGSVRLPGVQQYEPGQDLLDVIYRAGGPTEKGDLANVILVSQRGLRGQTTINLIKMLEEGHYQDVPVVFPGDVIIINDKSPWKTYTPYRELLVQLYYVLSVYVLLTRI